MYMIEDQFEKCPRSVQCRCPTWASECPTQARLHNRSIHAT